MTRAAYIGLLITVVVIACADGSDMPADATRTTAVHDSVRVQVDVSCGSSLEIDSAAATVIDWNDESRTWTAEMTDSTLVLTRTTMCGDECSMVERLELTGLGNNCPDFIAATIRIRDDGERVPVDEIRARAVTGTLQIQDWNFPVGVVSGKLDSEVKFTFYVVLTDD